MQDFDFTNSAVSSLNSIFSAVMGIAYPLILQAVEKLNEQYASLRIARLFLSEPVFRRYQLLLVISIVFALTSMFFLELLQNWLLYTNLFILFHSLVTLGLLYYTMRMVNLMIVYYDPSQLLAHIMELRGETDSEEVEDANEEEHLFG